MLIQILAGDARNIPGFILINLDNENVFYPGALILSILLKINFYEIFYT